MEIPEPGLKRFVKVVPPQIIYDLLCYNPFMYLGPEGEVRYRPIVAD
jgi:hypothetical protein